MSLVETASANALSGLIRIQQDRALDVIEVRKCMESWTAFYAAQRALPEDIRRMGTIIAGMERNLEGLQPSEDLDANFHIIVARATHNIVWLHLMQNIFDAMKEFQQSVWRAVYITGDDHHLLFRHHRAIFEAIEARAADTAREEMMAHLTFAEQRSIAFIRQSQSEA
jgi:GntR family transcriptional regulator, transcriptional repressor for pyruvate dehydrogenase complex